MPDRKKRLEVVREQPPPLDNIGFFDEEMDEISKMGKSGRSRLRRLIATVEQVENIRQDASCKDVTLSDLSSDVSFQLCVNPAAREWMNRLK